MPPNNAINGSNASIATLAWRQVPMDAESPQTPLKVPAEKAALQFAFAPLPVDQKLTARCRDASAFENTLHQNGASLPDVVKTGSAWARHINEDEGLSVISQSLHSKAHDFCKVTPNKWLDDTGNLNIGGQLTHLINDALKEDAGLQKLNLADKKIEILPDSLALKTDVSGDADATGSCPKIFGRFTCLDEGVTRSFKFLLSWDQIQAQMRREPVERDPVPAINLSLRSDPKEKTELESKLLDTNRQAHIQDLFKKLENPVFLKFSPPQKLQPPPNQSPTLRQGSGIISPFNQDASDDDEVPVVNQRRFHPAPALSIVEEKNSPELDRLNSPEKPTTSVKLKPYKAKWALVRPNVFTDLDKKNEVIKDASTSLINQKSDDDEMSRAIQQKKDADESSFLNKPIFSSAREFFQPTNGTGTGTGTR